ncbi:MAG: diadenylate cyclase CdaA [Spirochaetes bacterium]|nr:diadenylate cyclase CdaA [Spirochaetota bacterium]
MMFDTINNIIDFFIPVLSYLRIVFDIVIVAFLFYWIYSFLSNTKAIQLLKGLIVIFAVAILSKILNLQMFNWLIDNFKTEVVILIIVLFQPELRRLLTQFGQRNWLSTSVRYEAFPLDELENAVEAMSQEMTGSLIVIERNTGLKSYTETGITIDCAVSEEMIRTIFFPNTQLHDGAIIIREGRIAAAACYLPLSDSKQIKKHHGARHRAALGIAEETDALVVVTSEETGEISVMVNGKLNSKVKISSLKNMILYFMNPKTAYEEKYTMK